MSLRIATYAFALLASLSVVGGVQAQPAAANAAPTATTAKSPATPVQPVLDAHVREDIERHQGMARAHGEAAQCLQAGQPPEQCQKQLQLACKGLALGKNCGMRHSH